MNSKTVAAIQMMGRIAASASNMLAIFIETVNKDREKPIEGHISMTPAFRPGGRVGTFFNHKNENYGSVITFHPCKTGRKHKKNDQKRNWSCKNHLGQNTKYSVGRPYSL